MANLTRRDLRGAWRRRVFWAWVAASAAIGAYIGLASPVVDNTGGNEALVALALPPLMFFMLASGAGWLVLFVFWRRERRDADESGSQSSS